jgi:nicotinamide-nucleotide amidase
MGACRRAGTEVPLSAATIDLVGRLAEALRRRRAMLATAESCTGGLIAAVCTDLAGSSEWFERGIVSYSNLAKQQLLGVPSALLQQHGAVSEAVARAMATGLLERAPVHMAVAVTGIAGPTGGSADKPVGLVWLAWAWRSADAALQVNTQAERFSGDRAAVRQATVTTALEGVLQRVLAWPDTPVAQATMPPAA